eukprot:11349237-Alexandrium_andersonii.AAC.1
MRAQTLPNQLACRSRVALVRRKGGPGGKQKINGVLNDQLVLLQVVLLGGRNVLSVRGDGQIIVSQHAWLGADE